MKSSPMRDAVSSTLAMSCWLMSSISGWPDDVGTLAAWLVHTPA